MSSYQLQLLYILKNSLLTLEQLVERVEVVLALLLPDHPGLLKEVVVDVTAHGITLKHQFNTINSAFTFVSLATWSLKLLLL